MVENPSGIPLLPRITGLLQMDRISFSSFWRMRTCFLSGVPAGCLVLDKPFLSSLTGKGQILGQVLHETLAHGPYLRQLRPHERLSEICNKIQTFTSKLQTSVSARRVVALEGDIALWRELGTIVDYVNRTVESDENAGLQYDCVERAVSSKDGQLRGILDAVMRAGTSQHVVEYKSGAIGSDIAPNTRYVEQLHFYAQLLKEESGEYPRGLQLRSLSGEKITIEVSEHQSESITAEARDLLVKYNAKVDLGENVASLANASEDNCRFCGRQVLCPCYDLEKRWHDSSKLSVSVRARVLGTQNSGRQVKLLVKTSNCEMPVVVRGVPPWDKSNTPDPNCFLVISGLHITPDGSYAEFAETSQAYLSEDTSNG